MYVLWQTLLSCSQREHLWSKHLYEDFISMNIPISSVFTLTHTQPTWYVKSFFLSSLRKLPHKTQLLISLQHLTSQGLKELLQWQQEKGQGGLGDQVLQNSQNVNISSAHLTSLQQCGLSFPSCKKQVTYINHHTQHKIHTCTHTYNTQKYLK